MADILVKVWVQIGLVMYFGIVSIDCHCGETIARHAKPIYEEAEAERGGEIGRGRERQGEEKERE